jgi:uncharacterized protein DUF695
MPLFKRKSYPKLCEFDAQEDLRDWMIYTLTNEEMGATGIIRIRRRRPPYVDTTNFDTAISIRWRYASEMLPDDATSKEMIRFEEAVDDLTAANDLAELVYVRTGFGEREWLFYAGNKSRFMAQFNTLLAGHPRYPIEIAFQRDPDWKLWREMLDPLLTRTEEA